MSSQLLQLVNPHYLQRVLDISKSQSVTVNEDIYTEKGLKLVAKNTELNDSLKDRLSQHKLAKPLENCIEIQSRFNKTTICDEFVKLIHNDLAIQTMLTLINKQEQAYLKEIISHLDKVPHQLISTLDMLSTLSSTKVPKYITQLMVSLIFGIKLKLSQNDLINIMFGVLFQDTGELYISPEFVDKEIILFDNINNWKSVMSHPIISAVIAMELGHLNKYAIDLIKSHHEKANGTGFPAFKKS